MTDDRNRLPAGVNVGLLEQQIDHQRIARRAYEIYESRHRVDGHADDDWSQAAAEYAARPRAKPTPFDWDFATSSFGDRVRRAPLITTAGRFLAIGSFSRPPAESR